MWRVAAVVVMLVGSDCADAQERSACTAPPPEQQEFESEFELIVEPNPVQANDKASLIANCEPEPGTDVIGGAGAEWECWDGDAWVGTHLLARAFSDADAGVIDLSEDANPGVPDVGLTLPQPVVIGDTVLVPGWQGTHAIDIGSGQILKDWPGESYANLMQVDERRFLLGVAGEGVNLVEAPCTAWRT